MRKNFSVKNIFNGNKNKKEFKTPKEIKKIRQFTERQEPQKVVVKKSTGNNSFPSDFGNGAFF